MYLREDTLESWICRKWGSRTSRSHKRGSGRQPYVSGGLGPASNRGYQHRGYAGTRVLAARI
jgi:hypothetical protein